MGVVDEEAEAMGGVNPAEQSHLAGGVQQEAGVGGEGPHEPQGVQGAEVAAGKGSSTPRKAVGPLGGRVAAGEGPVGATPKGRLRPGGMTARAGSSMGSGAVARAPLHPVNSAPRPPLNSARGMSLSGAGAGLLTGQTRAGAAPAKGGWGRAAVVKKLD